MIDRQSGMNDSFGMYAITEPRMNEWMNEWMPWDSPHTQWHWQSQLHTHTYTRCSVRCSNTDTRRDTDRHTVDTNYTETDGMEQRRHHDYNNNYHHRQQHVKTCIVWQTCQLRVMSVFTDDDDDGKLRPSGCCINDTHTDIQTDIHDRLLTVSKHTRHRSMLLFVDRWMTLVTR